MRTGDILPFKDGIGHQVAVAKVPFVPVRMRGIFELLPPGARIPKHGHISGVEINLVIPFAVAFVVSCFTSMGAAREAFLLLPFQASLLGCIIPFVSATKWLLWI